MYVYCICMDHTSPLLGFELTTFVIIGTDCTGNSKFNYHAITTTTASSTVMNVLSTNLYRALDSGTLCF